MFLMKVILCVLSLSIKLRVVLFYESKLNLRTHFKVE